MWRFVMSTPDMQDRHSVVVQTVTLITDGSADNRTGTGGWCAITRTPSALIELCGFASGTTSNRMELTAIIKGLKAIKEPSRVEVISDSAYALNSIREKWYETWIAQSERALWLHSNGELKKAKPRPNLDLWYQLRGLCEYHEVVPIKVKGHSGDYWNTRADRLADRARREQLTYTNELLEFHNVRCESRSQTDIQCKLHMGHSGPHYWTNGRGGSGIAPYGLQTYTATCG